MCARGWVLSVCIVNLRNAGQEAKKAGAKAAAAEEGEEPKAELPAVDVSAAAESKGAGSKPTTPGSGGGSFKGSGGGSFKVQVTSAVSLCDSPF